MSNTQEKIHSMLVEQFGVRSSVIDLDSSFQSIGLDVADLEELKILIDENFKLILMCGRVRHGARDGFRRA